MSPHDQLLYLFLTCGIIGITLAGLLVVLQQLNQKRKRRSYNDEVVQRLLDEMREQRVRDLYAGGAFDHPIHSRGKIIKVDFTEVIEEDEAVGDEHSSPLKYKLVYDEHLGIYCKKPR